MTPPKVQTFLEGDTVRITFKNGSVVEGVLIKSKTNESYWVNLKEGLDISLVYMGTMVHSLASIEVIKRKLPPEPPVRSIVGVTLPIVGGSRLTAMERYADGWYCTRHRLSGGYVTINGVGGGSGGMGKRSGVTPCPNCPDTWQAMHDESSPVAVLYTPGGGQGEPHAE